MSDHPPDPGYPRPRPGPFVRALDWLVARGTMVYWAIWIICGLLAAADFLYVKKVHFAIEAVPAAYGAVGFLAAALVALAARPLRRLVMREETYYQRHGQESDDVR